MEIIFLLVLLVIGAIVLTIKAIQDEKYKALETEVLKNLKFWNWNVVSYYDETVVVKSRRALENYDDIKFFKVNKEKLTQAKCRIERKTEVANTLKTFLKSNEYMERPQYKRLEKQLLHLLKVLLIKFCQQQRILKQMFGLQK